MMASTFGELYEWLEGPVAEHFVCPTPPAPSTSPRQSSHTHGHSVSQSMCWLPDGQFLSDNLIELRQVRVKPEIAPHPRSPPS